MNKPYILEAVLFQLNAGEKRNEFLQKAMVTQAKVTNFEGYLQRQLFESESGQWLDLVWWESMDFAKKASELVMQDDECVPFMQAINLETGTMYHFRSIDLGLSANHSAKQANALEAVFFKVQPEITNDAVIATSIALQSVVEKKQGYCHRQLNHIDGQWLDLVWWESLDLAMQAAREVENDASIAPHFSIFAGAEMQMLHFTPVKLEVLA